MSSVAGLRGEVRVAPDPAGVADAAAAWIAQRAAAVERFTIALSGGTTPRSLFETLASPAYRDSIDWARWEVFFADERAVPPDDPASNLRLVRDTLLAKVPVPPDQVHRMEADRADIDSAAADYSALLEARCGRPPRLEVVLLGLGENGHTASLFPDSAALAITGSWTARGRADYQPFDRITLTFPAINAAAAVAFLVTGASKRGALRGVIDGSVPAASVRPHSGQLLWFLDTAAAGNA